MPCRLRKAVAEKARHPATTVIPATRRQLSSVALIPTTKSHNSRRITSGWSAFEPTSPVRTHRHKHPIETSTTSSPHIQKHKNSFFFSTSFRGTILSYSVAKANCVSVHDTQSTSSAALDRQNKSSC